jgi:hypothetical protein
MAAPLEERDTFHLGTNCPVCEAQVIPGYGAEAWSDELVPACPHVFLIAHDEAISYLSPAALGWLKAADVKVDDTDGFIELFWERQPDAGRLQIIDAVTPLTDARVLAVYAPAPVFAGTYVGVSASHG